MKHTLTFSRPSESLFHNYLKLRETFCLEYFASSPTKTKIYQKATIVNTQDQDDT